MNRFIGLLLGVLLMVGFFLLPGCSDSTGVNASAVPDVQTVNYAATIQAMPQEEISDAERESLIQMREEEKLARDVYLTLYNQWNQRVFSRIAQSEQTHTSAIQSLLNKYAIPDPVVSDSVGVFSNPLFTQLFDSLTNQGSTSLEAALRVGAFIEEIDILDLQTALDSTVDNQDIQFVYQNLMRGSRNHLRSFVRNLSRLGITYSPQVMDEETYQAIINSPMEPGGPGQGQGARRGRGHRGPRW